MISTQPKGTTYKVPKIMDFKTLNLLSKKNNKSPAPELRKQILINETSRSQLGISPSLSNLGDVDETYFKIPGIINNFSSNNHQSRASILSINNAKTSL
jgi:hypothetical protein